MIRIEDEAEWSRIVDLPNYISSKKESFNIHPNSEELSNIAKRLKLVKIGKMEVSISIEQLNAKNHYMVYGEINSNVTYECVSSLEPFDEEINSNFSIEVRHEPAPADTSDDFDDEDMMDIEYSESGEIDLGEISVEYLSLSLMDHPKKPGTPSPEGTKPESSTSSSKKNTYRPFEGLKKLKS